MNSPITFTTEDIAKINLFPFARFVPSKYHFFFLGQPGIAPYKLLAYFSTLFRNHTLVEIGVHNGWGSLALSYNEENQVVGYDIDLSPLNRAIEEKRPNTSFKQGIAHEMDPEIILASPFIHFDAQHDGVYEKTFFDFLVAHRYRGWLVLDDIHLNDAMKAFWKSITIPKHDLTQFGHSTGTGLVTFNTFSPQPDLIPPCLNQHL